MRARVWRDAAAWLGLSLDEVANQRGGPCISAEGSPATAWVIPTDEELMIARHALAIVGLTSLRPVRLQNRSSM